MSSETITTDYLVVGAGAMGMAFVDALVAADKQATATLVDRRAKPGGHWVDAYPFVSLHQPASAYGVNSAPLGTGGADLSSRSEILAYYERAIQRLQATGRVRFMPKCDYRGDGQIVALLDPERRYTVNVTRRVVDAGSMHVEVPATHPPQYAVDDGVQLVPPNALATLASPHAHYTVIGAGKTAIDAILFLLDRGTAPPRIRWIISNDGWLWNRDLVQPGRDVCAEILRHVETISRSGSPDEVFLQLEQAGSLFRLDSAIMPSKWRCATVSPSEYKQLLSVTDQVRMGRVQRVGAATLHLDQGTLDNATDTLFIDCSANGLAARPPVPIFTDDTITLQSIYMCQQVFSAAIIGKLATTGATDEALNQLMRVVPHPEKTSDMPELLIRTMENLLAINRLMPFWLWRSRLNVLAGGSSWAYLRAALKAKSLLPKARSSVDQMAQTT
ncbi:NAD(P)/FAD-dependent oxidoreductase [bacterium]|nr:NAD(P)/FAD-dependent oxidoreductase [bacterium]